MDKIIIREIINLVSIETDIPKKHLYRRKILSQNVSYAVFLCMYFIKKYTAIKHYTIAQHFLKKRANSVDYACKIVENLRYSDKSFRNLFELVEMQIKTVNFNSIPQF